MHNPPAEDPERHYISKKLGDEQPLEFHRPHFTQMAPWTGSASRKDLFCGALVAAWTYRGDEPKRPLPTRAVAGLSMACIGLSWIVFALFWLLFPLNVLSVQDP